MNKRIVLITGGANGIGKQCVKAFMEAGDTVMFTDIDITAGEALAEESGAFFIVCDMSDEFAVADLMNTIFSNFSDIDVIINNVGISGFKPLHETTCDDFEKVLRTNLRSTFLTSQALYKHRFKRSEYNKYGRIINISSTRSKMSEPNSEAYAASKGGIISLTHALAVSFSDFAVTVNCISPGWIENGDYYALSESDHKQHPSGRVGKPADIAGLCIFLCEEKNDFINGQNITADGGMTIKMIYND